MTKRNLSGIPPTEFSEWLRHQSRISSNKGFRATNLDYIWTNEYSKKWMLIEEKRHMAKLGWSQTGQFHTLDEIASKDENYVGFFLIQFENTSPEDGRIFITKKFDRENKETVEVSKDELLDFLCFYEED